LCQALFFSQQTDFLTDFFINLSQRTPP
jgi:hypothetical protein